MLIDENNTIVNCSEHMVKVHDKFTFLEDDALTKSAQLPTLFSKTMQFFNHGKPKNDGSKIHTNIRILHSEDMKNIAGDLRYELEEEEITLGIQRVQHYAVVKIRFMLGIIDRTNL